MLPTTKAQIYGNELFLFNKKIYTYIQQTNLIYTMEDIKSPRQRVSVTTENYTTPGQPTQFDFPTELIDLPSKGKCYPANNPLSKGQLYIKYMTAKEEDILASQNLIKKGVVLDKLFESIVVDNVNINDIIIGDKNAILLATRILGYGADYDVTITDPFSGETQNVTINLAKIQIKEVDESLLNPNNRYTFELPVSKAVIDFKLLTHGDELNITAETQAMDRLKSKVKGDLVGSNDVTTRLRHMILSVNGNEDRTYINKWINNEFLARDNRAFRNYVKEISPDLDLTFTFVSDITGESEVMSIPFGINFFYPTN